MKKQELHVVARLCQLTLNIPIPSSHSKCQRSAYIMLRSVLTVLNAYFIMWHCYRGLIWLCYITLSVISPAEEHYIWLLDYVLTVYKIQMWTSQKCLQCNHHDTFGTWTESTLSITLAFTTQAHYLVHNSLQPNNPPTSLTKCTTVTWPSRRLVLHDNIMGVFSKENMCLPR